MEEMDLDPAIAAMLDEINVSKSYPSSNSSDDEPKFQQPTFKANRFNFEEKEDTSSKPSYEVDVRRKFIRQVERFYDDIPSDVFDDPSYYKTALAGEGDKSQRLHQLLSKYLTTKDVKDRATYRQQIVNVWWSFLASVSEKITDPKLPMPKKMLLRYGVALPSLFSPEQKELFSKVLVDDETREPVYYLDEWLKEVALGHIIPSATDEKHVSAVAANNDEKSRVSQLKTKNDVRRLNAEAGANSKEAERQMIESELKTRVEALCQHEIMIGLEPFKQAYTEGQKSLFAEIFEKLRALQKLDKILAGYLGELEESREIGISIEQKIDTMPQSAEANLQYLTGEFSTIRQMAKMTCGRRGNVFPVFTREFYHCTPELTGFRERVIEVLRWIETNDRTAFKKKAKTIPGAPLRMNRILPFVILLPTYGDFGFCWQPFDRQNRAMSRARIVVPMYPRNLKISMLMAVADYRWQYAKEKAVDWTDPQDGITGQYYQYIESRKIKGDLKTMFITDYVTWMTKEIEGTQILDKELRGIFWRSIPFCKERRELLSKRSMVYLDLYKKDSVRVTSLSQPERKELELDDIPYEDQEMSS